MLKLHRFDIQGVTLYLCSCLLLATSLFSAVTDQQQDTLIFKSDPFTLDLYHKINPKEDFKLRASILIKPKTDYRIAQASILNQQPLSVSDLQSLKKASDNGEVYYLRSSLRKKKSDPSGGYARSTQTLVKACSLYTSNLADTITVNLSPLNDFVNVNLYTSDPECVGEAPKSLLGEFNTTVLVESGQVGPGPDTATYIKRLEEERLNKAKEGKSDNRSFFAKYWIYIVPAVIILMIFSGPADQGGR